MTPYRLIRRPTRALRREAVEWLCYCVAVGVMVTLLLWAQGEVARGQMPIIYTDTYLPITSK